LARETQDSQTVWWYEEKEHARKKRSKLQSKEVQKQPWLPWEPSHPAEMQHNLMFSCGRDIVQTVGENRIDQSSRFQIFW